MRTFDLASSSPIDNAITLLGFLWPVLGLAFLVFLGIFWFRLYMIVKYEYWKRYK